MLLYCNTINNDKIYLQAGVPNADLVVSTMFDLSSTFDI